MKTNRTKSFRKTVASIQGIPLVKEALNEQYTFAVRDGMPNSTSQAKHYWAGWLTALEEVAGQIATNGCPHCRKRT